MSDWLDMKEYDFKPEYEEYTFGPVNTEQDNVNNPAHYGQGNIEAIEYIEDFMTREEFIGYLRGNIAKYLHRWRYKNGMEDLEKAQWYLDALVTVVREGET